MNDDEFNQKFNDSMYKWISSAVWQIGLIALVAFLIQYCI